GCDHIDVNAAIGAAVDGSTILINSDKYTGQLKIAQSGANYVLAPEVKNLTIKGKGKGLTTWEISPGPENRQITIANITGINLTISDLNIANNPNEKPAIDMNNTVNSNTITIKNIQATKNKGNGIVIHGTGNNVSILDS